MVRRWGVVRLCIFAVLSAVYFGLMLFAMFNHRDRCKITTPFYIRSEQNDVMDVKDGTSHCFVDPETLTLVDMDIFTIPPMIAIEQDNPAVKEGGVWKPSGCQSLQKVAVIIPYRDRESHLKILLSRLHPMLQKQQIHYRIFLIEQFGKQTYNKGKLMNVGFNEALTIDDFNCVIFHDVDMIPENDKNLYQCDVELRHLSPAIDEMRYQLIYENLIGGVLAVNPDSFRRSNGYSNMFWGWGGEDDDLAARTEELGLSLSRPPSHIGRFKMIKHKKAQKSHNAKTLFLTWRSRLKTDGLNNTVTMSHSIVGKTDHKLYTHIMVDVGPPVENILEQIKDMELLSDWWLLWFYHP